MRSGRALDLAAIAALVAALAAAPPASAWEPVGRLVDPEGARDMDAIPYRALVREDFRAGAPPPEVQDHARQLGAVTCAYLVPAAPLRAAAHPVAQDGDRVRYRGELSALSFRAVMDRGCSWWRGGPVPDGYILEHEQVHFALTEIAARRLNARGAKLAQRFRAEADTPDLVVAAARAYVEDVVREAMEELLARNARFDRDTSLRHQPDVQARWRERVEAELGETRSFAAQAARP